MEVQRLGKTVRDQFEIAQQYYKILSVLNDLDLAKGEIQLIAFTAIKGNITLGPLRKEYCKIYKTTTATINNIVHRMKKKYILQKVDGLIIVNPALTQLDFTKPLALIISVTIGKPKRKKKVTRRKKKTPPTVPVPKLSKEAQEEQSSLPNMLNTQKYG